MSSKKILFSTGICYNICIEIIDEGQPYDACDTKNDNNLDISFALMVECNPQYIIE